MTEFTLDTSGAVLVNVEPKRFSERAVGGWLYRWTYLDPFTQGYVRAAFESLATPPFVGHPHLTKGLHEQIVGFSDLAPETLAAMMKDCADRVAEVRSVWASDYSASLSGAAFYRLRQDGDLPQFPPVTLYLGADGKVYQREGAQS